MDDKKGPQLFNSGLFSSPGGGLSFGLDDAFSSPISLAPALVTGSKQENGSKRPSVPVASPSSSSSSPGRGTPPTSHAPRHSSSPAVTQEQPVTTSGVISMTGLSTVSLDSPTTATEDIARQPAGLTDAMLQTSSLETTTSVPSSVMSSSVFQNNDEIDYRGGGKNKFGWNDPPPLSKSLQLTPNRPVSMPGRSTTAPVESNATDIYPIQPLAGHLEPQQTNATMFSKLSHAPPTNASVQPALSQINQPQSGQGPPPPQSSASAGSNPYRIGTGIGSKKPAYGVSGIASFGTTSQAPSQPMMNPSQPDPQSIVQPFSQPPPLSQGAPLPTSYETASLPPVTGSTYPPPLQTEPPGVGGPWAGALQPLRYHWFYLRAGEKYWIPFSQVDCNRLEEAFVACGLDTSQEVFVPTDGGRYDVDLNNRKRQSIYWEEPASEVRRCSWFFKGEGDRWYLPYDESTAAALEEEYLSASSQGTWNRRVDLSSGESVIMHSRSAIVHYPSPHHVSPLVHDHDFSHPRSVLRGFAEVDKVEAGEQSRIDHLVFIVHGIGAQCDLSFQSLVDCVDDFREVAQLMIKTHSFAQAAPQRGDNGGRVEFLPVHWHASLHKDECGVDARLKPLTLPSISRLRDFTNSTLMDILFFTSPIYCQTIVTQVASEMNRMYEIFKARNPSFQGGVSVMGHSLGSCVLFDLLYHQDPLGDKGQSSTVPPTSEQPLGSQDTIIAPTGSSSDVVGGKDEPDAPALSLEEALRQLGLETLTEAFHKEQVDYDSLLMCSNEDLKELGVPMGPRKKLSSFIIEQNESQRIAKERKEKERLAREREAERVQQEKEAVDAAVQRASLLGVKIVRGVGGTGQPFIDYPHLNFEPRHLFAVGSPVGLFLCVRGVEELGPNFKLPTCPSVYNIFHPFDPVAYRIEPLVTDSAPQKPLLMPHHKGRKRFHLELYENIEQVSSNLKTYFVDGMRNMWQQLNEFARSHTNAPGQEQLEVTDGELPPGDPETEPEPEAEKQEAPIGILNQGARIDYVLQEKPIEKLNEYLFALGSHLCYWRSEDTALFILKEVYSEAYPELIKS